MRLLALLLASIILTSTMSAYAQKSRNIEQITIPYTAFNAYKDAPEYYTFESKHEANFVLNINNQLIYNTDNPDAKAVIRLKESKEGTKFAELVMFGLPSKLFRVSLSNELGYVKYYEGQNAWFEDKVIGVSFMQNEKLSVHNGQRNVMDRFRFGPFTLQTLEVFGRDNNTAMSVVGGQVILDITSGNPLDSPVMLMPPIVAAITAGVIITLLKTKRRS